jgi:hypothetical protein
MIKLLDFLALQGRVVELEKLVAELTAERDEKRRRQVEQAAKMREARAA